jgi:hypothetical protein
MIYDRDKWDNIVHKTKHMRQMQFEVQRKQIYPAFDV